MRGLSTADRAAVCNVALGTLRAEDERLFRASAEAYVVASEYGASDVAIGAAVKSVADGRALSKAQRRELITSSGGVGFHKRTGLALRLPGELPDGVSARELQSLIKKLPTSVVDHVLETSQTQAECYVRLDERVSQKYARRREGR